MSDATIKILSDACAEGYHDGCKVFWNEPMTKDLNGPIRTVVCECVCHEGQKVEVEVVA